MKNEKIQIYNALDKINFSGTDKSVFNALSEQIKLLEKKVSRSCLDQELYPLSSFYLDSSCAPLKKLFVELVNRLAGDAGLLIEEFNNIGFSLAHKDGLYYFFHKKQNADATSAVQIQYWIREKGVIGDSMHLNIEAAIGGCGVRTLNIVNVSDRDELEADFLIAESNYQAHKCSK